MSIETAIKEALASSPDANAVPDLPHRRATKEQHGGLTAREREIVTHVVVGKTNREIAAALFVTEKTIEWHVTNSLQKLGFRTRAELAVWAVTAAPLPPK